MEINWVFDNEETTTDINNLKIGDILYHKIADRFNSSMTKNKPYVIIKIQQGIMSDLKYYYVINDNGYRNCYTHFSICECFYII